MRLSALSQEFDKGGSGAIDLASSPPVHGAAPARKRELDEHDHLDMDDNGRIGFDEFISFWRNS